MNGSLYAIGDTCYLKYYTIVDGKRAHKTVQLCKRDDKHDWWKKTKNGKARWSFSQAVRELQQGTITRIKAEIAAEAAKAAQGSTDDPGAMRVADFWKNEFLPYCENIVPLTGQPRMKSSTVYGFKQIWNQHLKNHFSDVTLNAYVPVMGRRFLRSLVNTQRKNTLKHIKALARAIFNRAVETELIKVNPWHDVSIPSDAIENSRTQHYTLEEAEDLISALADHVDCQLILALSCFLALRPGEIAALRWEDFDDEYVHIRRSIVRGIVGTPKTLESMAPLPLIDQVRIPLELWRRESGKCESGKSNEGKTSGWLFESRKGTPVDLHNLIARVIRPHVEGAAYQRNKKPMPCVRCGVVPEASGVAWKELYAGRRGAATAVIEENNGNLAIGQALLRHKSQITTATFYKKQITPRAFQEGMKRLQLAANGAKSEQS